MEGLVISSYTTIRSEKHWTLERTYHSVVQAYICNASALTTQISILQVLWLPVPLVN